MHNESSYVSGLKQNFDFKKNSIMTNFTNNKYNQNCQTNPPLLINPSNRATLKPGDVRIPAARIGMCLAAGVGSGTNVVLDGMGSVKKILSSTAAGFRLESQK